MGQKGIPVLVSLQSMASVEGEESETISLITMGELVSMPAGYQLRYEETLDESLSATQVELTLENDVATMCRSGDYEVNMVFRKGHRYEGQYHTPHGTFDLALFCTKINSVADGPEGELYLQYQLDINGQFVAVHQMELHFSPKETRG